MGREGGIIQPHARDAGLSFVKSTLPSRLYLIGAHLRGNGYCLHMQQRAPEFDREAGIVHNRWRILQVVMGRLVYCV